MELAGKGNQMPRGLNFWTLRAPKELSKEH